MIPGMNAKQMKKMERQNFSGNGRILRYAFCIKIDTMRNVVNKLANWIICFDECNGSRNLSSNW